jgi:translation initiation factor 2B subunit (eIF-2B alpha/beta/delta family)
MGNPTMIRSSMQLLKELTEVLRAIISSSDEESFRQLQQTIALAKTRLTPNTPIH